MASISHRENLCEHQSTMFSSLHEKQKQGKFCDVILKCSDSDQTFNAHSCVLSAASLVLDKMLNDAMDDIVPVPGVTKFTITMPSDVESSCMESLLNFIYSGNIDLNLKKAETEENTDEVGPDIPRLYSFLKASRRLEIHTLTEHLESAVTLSEMKMSDARDTSAALEFVIDKEDSNIDRKCQRVQSESPKYDRIATKKPSTSQNCITVSKASFSSRGETIKLAVQDTIGGKNSGMVDKIKAKETSVENSRALIPKIIRMENTIGQKPAASPKKTRTVKQLQCPTCQEVFKLAPAYEVHMKNHIAEIEITLSENSHVVSPKTKNSMNPAASSRDISRERPKLASSRLEESPGKAVWPQQMSADNSNVESKHDVLISCSRSSSESDDEGEQGGVNHPIIFTAGDENIVLSNMTGDMVEVAQSQVTLDEAIIAEPNESQWQMAEKNIPTVRNGGNDTEQTNVLDTNSHRCCECGKDVSNMKAHLKIHSRSLPCRVCGETFKYRSALNRHMQFHYDGLSCSLCGDKLFSQRDMTKHMAKHNHKKLRTECPDCKKSFTSEYVMQLHRRTHTGEEKFTCGICSKRFPYKSSLKMHMLLHTGEKPYICSICGKCFVQKVHAKEHELQHQGIKRQFQCSICEKTFAHKCGLTRHIADIHNRSRPFVCDTCGKSFPRKTKLIEHKRMHTGEKPYICEICGMRYKANRSLKCHKKTEHGILVPDYEVGIWRKGPIPTFPVCGRKKPSEKRKGNQENTHDHKSILSFPFPISSTEAGVGKQEEMVTDIMGPTISGEEHVIDQCLSTNDNKGFHLITYPIPPTKQNFDRRCDATADTFQSQPLPPASTLTTLGVSHTLECHTFRGNKTFIVPLSSTTSSAVPAVLNTNSAHVPGMVLTYMTPPQHYVIAEESISGFTSSECSSTRLPDVSRSSSVPPMSTFSRASNASASHKSISPVQTLPGMHTFQPAVKFRVVKDLMSASDVMEMESCTETSTVADSEQISTVTPVHTEGITMQEHCGEWANSYP